MTNEAPRQKRRYQFTMWSLFVAITIVCVIMAAPQGVAVVLMVFVWAGLGAMIIALLILMQAPLYLLYRTMKKDADATLRELNEAEHSAKDDPPSRVL